MAFSYNGWPAHPNPDVIGIDRNFTAAGRRFPGGVKAGDVATVFRYLVEQFDRRVEDVDRYHPGDEWGWYYRRTTGGSSLSCHASGTAIDINATAHPYGVRGTFTAAQVGAIRQILAELRWVVRWGGDFSPPDEMHFEIVGTAAEVAYVANRIRNIEEDPLMPFTFDDLVAAATRGAAAALRSEGVSGAADAAHSTVDDGIDKQIKMLRRDMRKIAEKLGFEPES